MANLNFNSVKKKHLTVTLNDEENTTLLIMSPTKRIMDSLMSMENLIRSSEDADEDNEQIKEQIGELYQLCISIMNRNKGKIKISKNQLEEFFDIEDIMIFLKEYMKFVGSQISGKN